MTSFDNVLGIASDDKAHRQQILQRILNEYASPSKSYPSLSADHDDCLEYEDIDFNYDMLALIHIVRKHSLFKDLDANSTIARDMENFFCEPFSSVKIDPASLISTMATISNTNENETAFSTPPKARKVETFYSELQREVKAKCGLTLTDLKLRDGNKLGASAVGNTWKWRNCREFMVRRACQAPFIPEYYRDTLIAKRRHLFQKIVIEQDETVMAAFIQERLQFLNKSSDSNGDDVIVDDTSINKEFAGESLIRSISKSQLRSIFRRAGCPFEDVDVFPLCRERIDQLLTWTINEAAFQSNGNKTITTDTILKVINASNNKVYEPKEVWGFGGKNEIRYLLTFCLMALVNENFEGLAMEGAFISVLHDMLIKVVQSLVEYAINNPTYPNRVYKYEKQSRSIDDFGISVDVWVPVAPINNDSASQDNVNDQPIVDYRAIIAALPSIFPGEQLGEYTKAAVNDAIAVYAGLPRKTAYSFETISSMKIDPNTPICKGGTNSAVYWILPEIIALICSRLEGDGCSIFTYDAIVAISSTVEYIALELLSGAQAQVEYHGTNVFSPIHIERALHSDEDMLTTFPGHCRYATKIENIHKSLVQLHVEKLDDGVDEFRSRVQSFSSNHLRSRLDLSIHPLNGLFYSFDANGLHTQLPGLEIFSTLSSSKIYHELYQKLSEPDRVLVDRLNLCPLSAYTRRLITVKEMQRSTSLAIDRLTFQRLAVNIALRRGFSGATNEAIELLQVFIEHYILSWVEQGIVLMIKPNRRFVMREDMVKALSLRNEPFITNQHCSMSSETYESDEEMDH